jgi:hypothetical protein
MPRKPLAAVAASVVTVLAAAGLALAHGGAPSSVQATSATFDATTVSHLKSGTCTGADGTYTLTNATYTGTSTSTDANLSGTLTVHAKTVYNADTSLGVVDGNFRVQTASGHTDGHFKAVDTGGSLAGATDGHAETGTPHQHLQLLGTVSGTFDPATGLSGVQLGSGTSNGAAVFVAGHCPAPKPPKPHGDQGKPHGQGDKGNKGKKGKHGKH